MGQGRLPRSLLAPASWALAAQPGVKLQPSVHSKRGTEEAKFEIRVPAGGWGCWGAVLGAWWGAGRMTHLKHHVLSLGLAFAA